MHGCFLMEKDMQVVGTVQCNRKNFQGIVGESRGESDALWILIYSLCRMSSSKMAHSKFPDDKIDHLINLWESEPALWNSNLLLYSNADERKAALTCISNQLNIKTGIYCKHNVRPLITCNPLSYESHHAYSASLWHNGQKFHVAKAIFMLFLFFLSSFCSFNLCS